MPKFKSKKSPYGDLPPEFKAAIEDGDEALIRQRLSEVALAEATNLENKKKDEDLMEKKEQAKLAGEQYKDATKMNRLKVDYCKFILESRGG